MSENLSNFLVDLATNPDLLGRVTQDPEGELARTMLTPAEREVLLTRDSRRVGAAIGASPAKAGDDVKSQKKTKRRPAKKTGRKPSKKKR